MERDPPPALDVGRDALDDIKRNFDVVKSILAPVLPLLILLTILDTLLNIYFTDAYGNVRPIYNLFALFYFFFTAWISVHYIMRWHLYTLQGSAEHGGTWLKPDVTYKRFFLKTLILQFLAFIMIFLPMIALIPLMMVSPVMIPVVICLIIAIFIFALYAICRLSFILPATTLGHRPKFREIWKFAKGMTMKTLWAPIRATLVYIIIAAVVFLVLFLILSGLSIALPVLNSGYVLETIMMLVIVIPAIILGILWGFVYVGVLSRYYLWGLDNRTDDYGDFK